MTRFGCWTPGEKVGGEIYRRDWPVARLTLSLANRNGQRSRRVSRTSIELEPVTNAPCARALLALTFPA